MARLAMPVQGLRSHPLQEIHLMDFGIVSQAGDRFTQRPRLPAGFAMTVKQMYSVDMTTAG